MDALLSKLSALPSQLSIEFQWDSDTDKLSWFEAQSVFPKFYWFAREGKEEVFALGQLCSFADPCIIEPVLNEKQRIWGGVPFISAKDQNEQSPFFFLPQIEIERQNSKWMLTLNTSETVQETRKALKKLTTSYCISSENHALIKDICYEPDYKEWCDLVDRALCSIAEDDFQKVVLTRKTRLRLAKTLSPMQLLRRSQKKNKACYHFMMTLEGATHFLGSTPEQLFCRQGQVVFTEALAGTIRRGENDEEDKALENWLRQDDKNNRENQLVVDDIFQRLTPFCSHMHAEPIAKVVKLRNVQHLKRAITASLHTNISHSQLLNSLQPTAATAGYPRDPAIEFISENEPFERNWYTGSVGYISREKSEFCVAIRSALIFEKKVDLYAGAGIVKGSQAGSEWRELNCKTATLQSLFVVKNKLVSIPVAEGLAEEIVEEVTVNE